MSTVVACDPVTPDPALIARAARIIRDGGLVAFPTETVYGLGANALDPTAVAKVFAAKQRPGWDPLIVHVSSREMVRQLARTIPESFARLADAFWPGPLTLILEKSDTIPDTVTAGRAQVALRLPRHPVITALLQAADRPIAAPSANRFGRPSPTCAHHVADDLGEAVDLILDAGPTPLGVESTVLNLAVDPPAILRPGGISREQLETVLGRVITAAPIIDTAEAEGLVSPGTSPRHYSPAAAVELFETRSALDRRAEDLRRAGTEPGILDETADLDRYARELYGRLRDFDREGVTVILVLLPPPTGLGVAIRDRLTRAATRPPENGIAPSPARR